MNFETVNAFTDHLVEIVRTAPAAVSALILFSASFLEYIIPIVPGDTVVIAGGFFAARGALSLYGTFLILTCASTAGGITCWYLGKLSVKNKSSKEFIDYFINEERMQSVKTWYKKYGVLLIAFNRFIPGVRGALLYASGIADIPLFIVVFWGFLSAALWNALLLAAGYWVSDQIEVIIDWITKYTQFVLLIFAIIFVLWLARLLANKRVN